MSLQALVFTAVERASARVQLWLTVKRLRLPRGPGLCGALHSVLHLKCVETPPKFPSRPLWPCGLCW